MKKIIEILKIIFVLSGVFYGWILVHKIIIPILD